MSVKHSEVPELRWFKSSYSGGEGGDCVEVALTASAMHVRDSKVTEQSGFSITPSAWNAFLVLARRR
jgi:hypothetical protein